MRFDKRSFLGFLSSFTPYWDYKPTNADNPGVYTSDEILNLNTINEIQLNFDLIDGSVVTGVRGPILFRFILDKPAGYKVFCEPETTHYKKLNHSLLKSINFYSENDKQEEVEFIGETLILHHKRSEFELSNELSKF